MSATTVAKLLKESGYSLQANAKAVEGKQHPDRDAQFEYLNSQAMLFTGAGDPVISVDTKKKELVGNFAADGREYEPVGQPRKVLVHDFADKDLGKVAPYGVYDIAAGGSTSAPTPTPGSSPWNPSAAGGTPWAATPTPVPAGC